MKWIEDESRNRLALWIAKLPARADDDQVVSSFISDLGLPDEEMFRAASLDFERDPARPLERLLFIESFGAAARRAVAGLPSFNAALAVHNYFPDGPIPKRSGPFRFVDYFDFDPAVGLESRLRALEGPRGRVSIWVGAFQSKASIAEYFGLPDHLPKRGGFQLDFENDFEITDMDRDFTGVELTRGLKNKGVVELVERLVGRRHCPAIQKAVEMFPHANFIFFAHRYDYASKAKIERVEFTTDEWISFVGTFDGAPPA